MRHFCILILVCFFINNRLIGQNASLSGIIKSDNSELSHPYIFLSNSDTTISYHGWPTDSFTFKDLTHGEYQLRIYAFGKQKYDTFIKIDSMNLNMEVLLSNDPYFPEYPDDSINWGSYNKKTAKNHIKSGYFLLLQPGGKPRIHVRPRMPIDYEFQRKYKVLFTSQGCIRAMDDDEKGYNKVVFRYLDKKHGRKWRKELQLEIIGLETKPNKR